MKKSLEEQRDEEEGAALVPQHEHRQTISSPSPPHQDPEQSGDDDDDDAHHHHLVAAPAWWRRRAQKLVPTRGVGLVMAGLLVLALLVGSGSTSRWIHLDGYASLQSFLLGSGGGMKQHRWLPHHVPSPEADLVPIPFSCGNGTGSPGTCRRRRDTTTTTVQSSPSPSPSSMPPVASSSKVKSASKKLAPPPPPECPEYFRYIHSDLSPWRETGITREAVERGRHRAAFRLVVVDGRAYVETYHRVFQTRDTFTQWGIAQLLARYPGRGRSPPPRE